MEFDGGEHDPERGPGNEKSTRRIEIGERDSAIFDLSEEYTNILRRRREWREDEVFHCSRSLCESLVNDREGN